MEFETLRFHKVAAAVSLRCGGMCNDYFVAHFALSLAVKEF